MNEDIVNFSQAENDEMSKKPVPLGIEFYETVSKDCYYVDKTAMIEDLASYPEGTCLLFSRPRRFGKTLALSMLHTFFEMSEVDKSPYFSDKYIWGKKEVVEEEFQAYPLIHINMKNVIGTDFPSWKEKLKEAMRKEYDRHQTLLPYLDSFDQAYFSSVLNKTVDDEGLSSSLSRLSEMLHKHYEKKVVILIDEYDAPTYYAKEYSYYDEAITFLKQFYGESLKTNPSLRLAVLTGILEIGKESLFSGFNNLITNSPLSKRFASSFGFTESETKAILDYYGYSSKADEVRRFYGGYRFGDQDIYSALSILSFIQNGGEIGLYWSNTGENKLLREVCSPSSLECLLPLLGGESIDSEIDLSESYEDLDDSRVSLCSLLFMSGYLTIKERYGVNLYRLALPNEEIKRVFMREINKRYLSTRDIIKSHNIKKAFLDGDEESIKRLLEEYLLSSFSYYELNQEKEYQAMLAALLSITFDKSYVKSEFNAGVGRADLVVIPKGEAKKIGLVIETKILHSRTSKTRLEEKAKKALSQIKEKEYPEELFHLGTEKVIAFGICFYKNKAAVVSETIVRSF